MLPTISGSHAWICLGIVYCVPRQACRVRGQQMTILDAWCRLLDACCLTFGSNPSFARVTGSLNDYRCEIYIFLKAARKAFRHKCPLMYRSRARRYEAKVGGAAERDWNGASCITEYPRPHFPLLYQVAYHQLLLPLVLRSRVGVMRTKAGQPSARTTNQSIQEKATGRK
jgi:hypothetical protein